jgi:hypothetical protein
MKTDVSRPDSADAERQIESWKSLFRGGFFLTLVGRNQIEKHHELPHPWRSRCVTFNQRHVTVPLFLAQLLDNARWRIAKSHEPLAKDPL